MRDECLSRYLSGLSARSGSSRIGFLEDFFRFCECTASEAVAFQREDPLDYRFVDLAYRFLDTRHLTVSSKNTYFGVIRGFFVANRAPLPADRHVFKSDITPVVGELRLDEFRQILFASRLDKRCAFVMMFQSGSGLKELCYINTHYAGVLFDEVRKGAAYVCLNMTGRKQKRNVQPYYTFLGGDSLECLRQLFHSRGWVRDNVLFRTDLGEPVTGPSLHRYFLETAIRLGFVKAKTPPCLRCNGETVRKRKWKGNSVSNGFLCVECGHFVLSRDIKELDRKKKAGIRYRIHTHEIRDLFRTEYHRAQTYAGCDPALGEFMLGHTVDPLNYDKIMKDRSYAAAEYRKALPWLNILSEDPRVIDRCEVEDQLESQRVQAEVMSKKVVELERKLKVLDSPELRRLLKQLEEG